MSRRRLLSTILAWLAAVAPGALAQAPGNDTIRADELRADLYYLAGDGFRGRLTGTPENELASDFIAARFDRLGLKKVGQGESYFHRYHLVSTSLGDKNELRFLRSISTQNLTLYQDFYPLSPSGTGTATAEVVFAGYGIVAPEYGYDDYKGLNPRGKIVLVLDREPGESDPNSPFDGVVTSISSDPFRKAIWAEERGAIGLLVVRDEHRFSTPENLEAAARGAWPSRPPRLERYLLQTWTDRVHIPIARISAAFAERLIEGLPGVANLTELAKAADSGRNLASGSLPGARVSLSADVRRRLIPDKNVIAAIEGIDPKLKDEWIIISCHQDHDGTDGAMIYNGADDNGSGVVGLLEIAEAYAEAAKLGKRPRRSVLFAAFNSEERGLLGSWAFTERPIMPLDKIAAVLNMDMIGRSEEVPVGGGAKFNGLPIQTAESNKDSLTLLGHSRCASLGKLIEDAAKSRGLRVKKDYDNNPSNLIRRSDHWPFIQRGVPGVWFHTGLHPDYHTIYDRPERIDYPKMERVAKLVHQASWDLANQDAKPSLDPRK